MSARLPGRTGARAVVRSGHEEMHEQRMEGEKVGETTKMTAKEWAERLHEGSICVVSVTLSPQQARTVAALLLTQDALLAEAAEVLANGVCDGGLLDSDPLKWMEDVSALLDRIPLEPKEPTE